MSFDREISECDHELEVEPDDSLAILAKGGDREARNALYLRNFDLIKSIVGGAKHMVAGASDTDESIQADDVVQQTFLIFCNLLDKWQRGSEAAQQQGESFHSYLERLLPSQASHFVRDYLHYRSNIEIVKLYDPQPGFEPSLDDPHQQIEGEICWNDYTRNLTEELKRLITLRYSLRLGSGQIADLCGLSRRSVDRQLRTAISQIRDQLQSDWENCA